MQVVVESIETRIQHDIENSILLHRAFPDLTRVEAGDPRLWTRLTHVEGRAYMRKRWDVGQPKHADDPDKALRYALQHYFLAGSSPSRALTRNGMSRLWWYAALTHDPARSDPYELTRVLLSALDIAQQLYGAELRPGRAGPNRLSRISPGSSRRARRNRAAETGAHPVFGQATQLARGVVAARYLGRAGDRKVFDECQSTLALRFSGAMIAPDVELRSNPVALRTGEAPPAPRPRSTNPDRIRRPNTMHR